jgi:hypothetical protein
MVSMLALSAVDCVFEPWLGQTKDYKIGICCFSAKHAALRRKSVTQYKTVKMVMMRKCVVSYLTCIIYSDSLKHILLINNVEKLLIWF